MAVLMCSCTKPKAEELLPDCPLAENKQVDFTFEVPGLEPVTRALDALQEKAVSDLNLYIVRVKDGIVVQRHYQTSASAFSLTLLPGEYECYAVANAGRDLGILNAAGLQNLSVALSSQGDLTIGSRLMMACRQGFTVQGPVTVPVRLKRCAAKLTLNLSVSASFSTFTLRSIEVTGVPRILTPFTVGKATSASTVMNYPKTTLSGRSYSMEIYLPENAQGTVSGITSQQQRSRTKAPAQATCLHIEGEASGQKIDYYIYLGENLTDDFNVQRNRHYTLNATISGTSSVDLRLSTLSFALTPFKSTCYRGEQIFSDLLSTSTDPSGSYTLRYSQNTGNGTVTIDGKALGHGVPVALPAGAGSKQSRIGYTQNTAGGAMLTFTLTDSYGYAMQQTLSTVVRDPNPIQASFTMLPVQPVVGLKTRLSTDISETDYGGTFSVTFSYPDEDMEITVNESKIVRCGQAITLSGGLHGLSFTPKTAGIKSLRAYITDTYGQSKQIEVNLDVREPVLSATISAPSTFDAHTQTPISLTLSEEYYTGTFSVSYTSTGKECILYYNGKQLSKNIPMTLGSGTHAFSIWSTNAEAVSVTFTVTDQQGKSRTATYTATCTPMTLDVTLTSYIENTYITVTEGSATGQQAAPTRLMIRATTNKPVPGNSDFSLDALYTLGYYSSTTTKTETPTTRSMPLHVDKGSTQGIAIMASYTGYCMGSSSSYRRLLRPGYYFYTVYDRTTGTSYCPVTINIGSASTTGAPVGSIVYRYTFVNE